MDNPFPREVLWYYEVDDSMNIKKKASILQNYFYDQNYAFRQKPYESFQNHYE